MIHFRTLLYLLASMFVLSSCLKDEIDKNDYKSFNPVENNDHVIRSTPENEGMDRDLLEEAFRLVHKDDRFIMARSLLVFRNGKLVAESYPNNTDDINRIYNIQSCTKSITSLMTGIAVQDQYISSLDEPLYNIFPEHFDADLRKREITLKHALTMQTGLEFDNGIHTLAMYQTEENSAKYVLSQEYKYQAGLIMKYNDGAPQLVSKVLENKTGMSLQEYADLKLFEPLGIENWKWEASHDGTNYGAFSLYLTPRDFGKIGQLLLQHGQWNDTSIIDSTYLVEATDIQVSANYNHEPYGYYFWILPAYSGYVALGHGGQFLLIVPNKNLVVVYTAWPYTSGQFFDQRNDLMALIYNSCT